MRTKLSMLAAAVIGVAAAGCSYDQQYGTNGSGHEPEQEVMLDPQLANYQEEAASKDVPNLGEAAPDEVIASSQEQTKADQWLTVRSDAFGPNQPIPQQFGEENGAMPPIEWSQGPAGTQSYAVIVEDPDSTTVRPFVHALLYNIPASQTQIRAGAVDAKGEMKLGDGAAIGANSAGEMSYHGIVPPAADPAHSYHFQVFALDTTLNVHPGATKQQVLDAMKGHVLAKGSIVGTFDRN